MPRQHINLLQREAAVPRSLWWGSLGMLGWTAALLVWGGWLLAESQNLAKIATDKEQQVEALRTALTRRTGAPPAITPATEDLGTLRARAQGAQALADLLEGEGLDRPPLHVAVLKAMAGAHHPQVWLSQMTVSDGGRKLALQGHALEQAAVLAYQARLRQMLAPLDIAPSGVSFTQETGIDGVSALVIGFRMEL